MEPFGYYDEGYTSFNSVDAYRAVEIATGLPREEWPEDLERLVEEKPEWGDHYQWDVEYGYYEGDVPYATPPSDFTPSLEDWYWSQPNAIDGEGALQYVRGKGYETTGLKPAEAVKKMLDEENGLKLKWLDQAKSLNCRAVPVASIRVNTKHYEAVEPRKPIPAIKGEKVIDGVLHYSEKEGYRLLDGYHRLKANNKEGKKEGIYLILS